MNARTDHPLALYRSGHRPPLTQAQMAARFGVTQSFWSYLESGSAFARPALARKISQATGVNPDVLMNYGDNESAARPRARRPKTRKLLRKSL